jgi:hypothetical protein
VAQWVLSQDSAAETVMMANADAAGGIPWHFVDESTGTLINRDDYPYFWQHPRSATNPKSPQPTNGWPTSRVWTPDTAHLPDLNYVPYLTTGSHYQLKLLQAASNYVITVHNPNYTYDRAVADPAKPGSADYMGVASPSHQQRAIAWGLREVAEAAYIVPDDDPLKSYYTTELVASMNGLVKEYITDNSTAEYGDLQGFVLGSSP